MLDIMPALFYDNPHMKLKREYVMNILKQTIIGSLVFIAPLFAGRTVVDGFVSNLVGRSPDNPDLTDCRRLFNVYLPDLFDTDPSATFPIVYHLTGLGGNNATYYASDQAAMNMLLAAQQVRPMIIVAPDPRVLSYDGSFYAAPSMMPVPWNSQVMRVQRRVV